MKNFKIVLAALPLLGISCTDDYAGNSADAMYVKQEARMGDAVPANPANPFDSAGQIYDGILEILYSSKFETYSIEEVALKVDSAVALHPEWGLDTASPLLSEDLPAIAQLAGSSDALEDAVAGSGLSLASKSALSGFAGQLSLHESEPYEALHALALAYESGILGDGSLAAGERQALLGIASIARYSFYRKKRKDKDWETSVSIAGAVAGSAHDFSLTVRMAAVVGICRAYGITE